MSLIHDKDNNQEFKIATKIYFLSNKSSMTHKKIIK